MKLPSSYFLNDDAVFMAKAFLGKVLCTNISGACCAGMITETEAYAGVHDRASHAWGDRHTERTAPMYMDGGIAYVYLIYGMYSLFNIVTAPIDTPHAILVRAIKPLEGIEIMKQRRNFKTMKGLTDGPGKLSIAMGIHFSDTGVDLGGNRIWVEDRGAIIDENKIISGPRIGVEYAGEDAGKPFRFILNDIDDLMM